MNRICVPKLIANSYQSTPHRVKLIDNPINNPSQKAVRGKFDGHPINFVKPCCLNAIPVNTSGYTQVKRQTTIISYRPQRKTIFGDRGYPYETPRLVIGGKVEGQLGGSLAKPNNF
jgi:hypothetical protein